MMQLHSIRQAGRATTHRHPSAVAIPATRRPAMRVHAQGAPLKPSNPSHLLDEQLTLWAKARMTAMVVDLERRDDSPDASDTTLARPWRVALVPRHRLELLRDREYPCAGSSTMLWGIGPERPMAHCNPHDVNPGAIDCERSSSRPGKGPFPEVARGAYGNRNFKYLWAIDHRGMHIAREMTPCKLSSRGIITHSILVGSGVIGGEIFFDRHEPGKVFVNFGSARLPLNGIRQAERTAEFVLALGYHTVVAMIPDRSRNEHPYGMCDRYGNQVQNMVFRLEE